MAWWIYSSLQVNRMEHHLYHFSSQLRFKLLVPSYLSSSHPLASNLHGLEKSQNWHNTREETFFPRAEDVSGGVVPISGRLCFYNHPPLSINHRCSAINIHHQLDHQKSEQISPTDIPSGVSNDLSLLKSKRLSIVVSNVPVTMNAHSAVTSVWWRTYPFQENIWFKSIIRRIHMSYQGLRRRGKPKQNSQNKEIPQKTAISKLDSKSSKVSFQC